MLERNPMEKLYKKNQLMALALWFLAMYGHTKRQGSFS